MHKLLRVLLAATILMLTTSCGKHRQTLKETELLIENKNYDGALVLLQRALQEDPKDRQLLRQQVMLFLYTEHVNYARAAYQRLEEAHPGDPVLIKALAHENPAVQVTAAKALGYLKDVQAIEALSVATRDHDKSVRRAAVLALGDLKHQDAIPALIDALEDSYWYVRAEAALALGKIGDTQSATRLFSMLQDSDPYVRDNAREALQDLATDENKQAYLSALKSDIPATRLMAAIALAYAGDNSGSQILANQLADHESSELLPSIKAASALKDPALLPALRNLMSHQDHAVAASAILALGELKDNDSAAEIKARLQKKSESKIIKTACLMALELMSK